MRIQSISMLSALVDIRYCSVTIYYMEYMEGDERPELWVNDACGVDPDQTDPSCEHPYTHLGFDSDDNGLECALCGESWSTDGSTASVLAVWQSCRVALVEQRERNDALASVLASISGQTWCTHCGKWGVPELFVVLDGVALCREHVGSYYRLNYADVDDNSLVQWLTSLVGERGCSVNDAWIIERVCSEYNPEISEYFNNTNSGDISVDLCAEVAETLKVDKNATIRNVANATARVLGLPIPASRPGRALVLGLLAKSYSTMLDSYSNFSNDAELDADELTIELHQAVPSRGIDRATAVLDLYRDEIQEDATVNGELADSLLEALAQSSAAILPAMIAEQFLRSSSRGPSS